MNNTAPTLFFHLLIVSFSIIGCNRAGESLTDTDANTRDPGDTTVSGDTDTTNDQCDIAAEFSRFFQIDRVVQINIDFNDPDAYADMVANKTDGIYRPATVTIDGETLENVGVRFKGNSSLQMSGDTNTKSFKLDFKEFVPGQRFHCMNKISLNNATKDPSMMREALAYEMAREFDIPAPKTTYGEVTVDGTLHGLFTVVQQVDHRFLKDQYGTIDGADDGNLYKLYSDYDFSFLGDDAVAADYGDADLEVGLVLKTNETDDTMNTYADVTAFTKALDMVLRDPTDANQAALEALFDVEEYLRFQAWTLAISNLDAYYSMQHNLFLHRRMTDGRFEVIPWDTNEAFGAFDCGAGGGMGGRPGDTQTSEDVYTVDLFTPCGADRPLNQLTTKVPSYKARYCQILAQLVDDTDGLYRSARMDERIEVLNNAISETRQRMETDGALTQPPGNYTFDDFLANQGHDPDTSSSSGPGSLSGGPNLGYFNDIRIAKVKSLIEAACP